MTALAGLIQTSKSMSGIQDIEELLSTMEPAISDGEFVFCMVKGGKYGDFAAARPIASFLEKEGLSLVLTKEAAEEQGFSFEGIYNCISLEVHSSLEAVGLTAAISQALSEVNIPSNVIAGYYHDHVFVPKVKAEHALSVLKSLSKRHS
jgi:hypothetical protein